MRLTQIENMLENHQERIKELEKIISVSSDKPTEVPEIEKPKEVRPTKSEKELMAVPIEKKSVGDIAKTQKKTGKEVKNE